ncbi:MAG: T9SS type A sorting domain-containing protein [Ignavibacteriales bacterium]
MKRLFGVAVLLLAVFLPDVLYAQLNGTMTIDANGSGTNNYKSLGAAIEALNLQGTTTGVTFLIANGNYTENSPINIDVAVNKPTESAPVTIKPASGATVEINIGGQDATHFYAIRIGKPEASTDYVTINGSNGVNTRDMTIRATDAKNGIQPVDIYGNNITIKNCIIESVGKGNIWDENDIGILLRSTMPFADYCTIENNKISGINGILIGKDTNAVLTGNIIRGNELHFYHKGIYAYRVSDILIENNEIAGDLVNSYQLLPCYGVYVGTNQGNNKSVTIRKNNIRNMGTNTGTTAGRRVRGIYILGPGNFTINSNKIHDLFNATTDTAAYQPSVYGIQLESGSVDSKYLIYNNAIYGLKDNDTVRGRTGTVVTTGIESTTPGNVELYFNTIYIEETGRNNHECYGLYIGKGDKASMIKMANNIIYNSNSSPNAKTYALFRSSTMVSGLSSDFNIIHVDGAQNAFTAFCGMFDRLTLQEFIDASPWDDHSIDKAPGFKSSSDVSIADDKWIINGQGIPVEFISEDIEGSPRSVSLKDGGVDIGAYEYSPVGSAATVMTGKIGQDTTRFIGVDGKKIAEIIWSGTNAVYPDQVTLTYTPGKRPVSNSNEMYKKGIDRMYSFSLPQNAGSGWTAKVRLYYNEATEIRDYTEKDLIVNKRTATGDGPWLAEQTTIEPGSHYAEFNTNTLGTYSLIDQKQSPLPVERQNPDGLKYSLQQNYPNPFNPATRIQYSIPEGGIVKIVVFNAIGQTVRTLVDEFKTRGTHEIIMDGNGLTSGIYYYQLKCGQYVETRKFVLMK